MPTSPTALYTDFSKDVLGRYVCDGLDEALRSTSGRSDARAFDIVIVGGGSFGGALAQHLLYADKFLNHRILVLEAGPFFLPEHMQNLPNQSPTRTCRRWHLPTWRPAAATSTEPRGWPAQPPSRTCERGHLPT